MPVRGLTRWLRHLLVAAHIAFNKVTEFGSDRQWQDSEEVEPEREQDEWEQLMHRYTSGTEEEQAEADDLLTNPARKRELDDLFLARFKDRGVAGKSFFPKRKGTDWTQGSDKLLDTVQETSRRNYAEQKSKIDEESIQEWKSQFPGIYPEAETKK